MNCSSPEEADYPVVIGWRVWFDDGGVYDSTDHAWAELPADGVLGIVLFQDGRDPEGNRLRQHLQGYDTYFESTDRLTAGRFLSGNNDAPDTVVMRYVDAVVKRGRWASTETVHRVLSEMNAARWHDDGA